MKEYQLPAYPVTADVWDVLRAETRPLIVYGMGNGADKLLLQCAARGIEIADFMASDGFVRGQMFHGKTVLSFSAIKEKYQEFVIVLAFATSRPEVLEMLFCMAEQYPLIMPDLPVVGATCFDKDYYNTHYSEYREIKASFADAVSCNLYAAVLQYKLTGDIRILKDAATSSYETENLVQPQTIRTYVDCGAYRGDTLTEMIGYGAPLKQAVCIEPDRRNYKKLCECAASFAGLNVTCIHAAVAEYSGIGTLAGSGNRNSSLVGSSYESRVENIPLVTVDSVCADLSPDYIKYDVEGAEMPAIQGSALTYILARPRVLLSLYHRTEDLIDLPRAMQELCKDYDFYLRRPVCVPAWELNLIAVPKEEK